VKRQPFGFTLVEIAIVLVIIGLLLGGVLKGQELITQAKIKNVANDFNGISAAFYGYQDRYKRLPGDDPGAKARWGAAFGTESAGDGTANKGDGDNVVEGTYASETNTDESRLFWAELRLAGFVAGDATSLAGSATQPLNAAGGILGVESNRLGLSGLLICSGSLPARIAQAIDSQFDDGRSATGNMRGLRENAPPTALGATPADSYEDNGTNLYVVCKNI
jgi:prepilin-type N-terminal cleavage/methylation domain-containing protein